MEQKPAFDKNTMLLIIFCIGIYWLWQQHLQQKYPDAMGPAAVTTPATQETARSDAAKEPGASEAAVDSKKMPVAKQAAANKNEPEKTWVYDDQDWRAVVSSKGGRISDVELKNYTDKKNNKVKLVSSEFPGYLTVGFDRDGNKMNWSNVNYKLEPLSSTTVLLTGQVDGLSVKKTLTFLPGKYAVHARIDVNGDTQGIKKVNVDVAAPAPPVPDDHNTTFFSSRAGQELQEYFFAHGTKTTRKTVTSKEAVEVNFDQTQFAALGSRYFTTMLYNRSSVIPEALSFREGTASVLRFSYPVFDRNVPLTIDFDLYAGPKSLQQLSLVDENAAKVVDYGFFSLIAVPLLTLMKWLFSIFKNYGVAIIALTILVRTLTFPFTYMSYKSMKAMQQIQPQIARLKEVYKDNTAALNQEMIKLMRENKVNPMGGCLPMLLQLPVFWALYQVLQNSIELYHSPFVGWIHDLSTKDPYYVLPILMGLSMFIQQKITPSTMDPAQAKVMMIMPVLFSFLMFSLPSGLTLYIFVSTLFGILQQTFMMRGQAKRPTALQTSH